MKIFFLVLTLVSSALMASPSATPSPTMTPTPGISDMLVSDTYDYYVTKVQLYNGRLQPSVSLNGLDIICVYSPDLTRAYVRAKNLDLITKFKFYFLVDESSEVEFNGAKIIFDLAVHDGTVRKIMGLQDPQ